MNAPSVAITIDDFEWDTAPAYLPAEQRNAKLLRALAHHNLQAAVFVNGQYVDEGKGPHLLKTWDKAGHLIGNHTYSHSDFNDPTVTVQVFAGDIRQNETYLRRCRHFQRFFRFPFLHEGNTSEKRDGLRHLLTTWGYHPAPVTIVTDDWAIDDRLRKRLTENPSLDLAPYRRFYVQHIAERAATYEALARKLVNRPAHHTLLIHHTLFNAQFLRDVLDMLTARGWHFANAADALAAPLFRTPPRAFPSNGSLLVALAKEQNVASGIPSHDDSGRATIQQMDNAGL